MACKGVNKEKENMVPFKVFCSSLVECNEMEGNPSKE